MLWSSAVNYKLFFGQRPPDTRRLIKKIKERMDARSAIADTMLLAMSTAMAAMPRRASRRLSDFSDIAHLTVSFHGIQLTRAQHQLIKTGFSAWRSRSECSAGDWVHGYVAGRVKRLGELFEKHPAISRSHAEAISSILDMAVESVESLDDSLGPLLVSYASEDGILSEQEGFDRLYWSRVSEGLCQLARQFPVKTNKYETVAAWRIVILFILSKLDQGFQLKTTDASPVGSSLLPSPNADSSFDNPCYKAS